MSKSSRKLWFLPAILLGGMYAMVGIVFARPATHVVVWRLAAWGISAIGYAAHIAYERFRLENPPAPAAVHVALAAALGAFGLAISANLHSLFAGSSIPQRQLLLLALGIWPILTAVPAFVIALCVSALLRRLFGRA
jgi:hypothetical protein